MFLKGTDGVFYEDKPNPVAKIVSNGASGFTLYGENDSVESYSQYGRVQSVKNEHGIGWTYAYSANFPVSVTHTSGRSVQFTWSGDRLVQVRDPAGNAYNYTYLNHPYGYNYSHILASTTKPGAPATTITYHYELVDGAGKRRDRLTGKSFNGIRYSKFTYDNYDRATSTEHNGLDKYTLSYTQGSNGDLTTVITNPLGKQTTHRFKNGKSIEVTGHASTYCPASYAATVYDSNGYAQLKSDFNGNNTSFAYNAKGQLTHKIEAYGTAVARKTTYIWDAVKNRLVSLTVGGTASGSEWLSISYAYTADNRIASVTHTNLSPYGLITSPYNQQVTAYIYTKHANGLLASVTVDGPIAGAGDRVTTRYASNGNLLSVENSLGHTITYENHNGLGQPGRVIGTNGEIKEYVYDARGRVTLMRTYPNGTTPADSVYAYSANGDLASITTADGVTTNFNYDSARRLIMRSRNISGVLENGGIQESQRYAYNAAGNVTMTSTFSSEGHYEEQFVCFIPSGAPQSQCSVPHPEPQPVWIVSPVLKRSSYIDYDELGRPRANRGNYGLNARYAYDFNGNVKTVKDSQGRDTHLVYDALDRLVSMTDPLGQTTYFEYDIGDRITKVTDPRGKITTYAYDGFGQLWAQYSPDTGSTTYQYNASGQLTHMVRNDGSALVYDYDGLGRLKWYGASSTEGRAFHYDTCHHGYGYGYGDGNGYGKGRLCAIEASGGHWTQFTYTSDGRLSTRREGITGNGVTSDYWTRYYYDALGRNNAITYPNGIAVGYGYASGKLLTMTVNIGGNVSSVVSDSKYMPFGPATQTILGNGLTRSRPRDLDGRLTSNAVMNGGSALQSLSYAYDADSQISQLTNSVNAGLSQQYAYDANSRLTGVTSGSGNQSFYWDANGNKTRHVWTWDESLAVDPSSNRIANMSGHIYGHDARGNRQTQSWAGSSATFAYNAFNNMSSVMRDVATSYGEPNYITVNFSAGTNDYGYNAFNERVWKSAPSHGYCRYVYGPDSRLMSEHKDNGDVWTNYLWFGGELVGITRGSQVYWVHGDHLGRPEIVTNSAKAVVWRASNYAFDRAVALDSIGGLNIGLPGQYYDQETGLWYNVNRYYDARLGRYTQSDPIGLGGGLNTYAYVGGNPISSIDPFGLTQCDIDAAFAFAKKMNPDIKFGGGAPKADMPRSGAEGEAQLRGGDGYIHLNERYLDVLDWSGVYNLLDTIIHEGLHFTRPIELQEKSNNYDHRYISPEATRRAREQVYDFNKERKSQCGCDQ